jgi:hypothetical protein
MGGCYRCGLPDGGPERLCETCFRLRFYRGPSTALSLDPETIEGIELSPRTNRAILAGGALFYLLIVGFFALTMGHPRVVVDSQRLEFVLDRESTYSPEQERSFGRVPAPQSWR